MEQDTIDLLKDLVAIDSQNPSLVPEAAGESQIAAYVVDWAKGTGLTAEIMEETPGRPSVVVRSGASSGASSARSLLHADHRAAHAARRDHRGHRAGTSRGCSTGAARPTPRCGCPAGPRWPGRRSR